MNDRASTNSNAFHNVLVIGASGGIGEAVAAHLENRGVSVDRLSRSVDGLDLKDERSIERAAAALSGTKEYDLIFLATGVLEAAGNRPEKSFTEIECSAMLDAYAVNTIGPALCIKHFSSLMTQKGRSVFAALSARVGSIGDNRLGGWMSYRASKAALNQIIRCAAIERRRVRPDSIFVAIHPGTVETALTRNYAKGRYTARPGEAAAQIIDTLSGLTSKQTGGFFAYNGEEIVW